MISNFAVVPYVCAGPINFGMSRVQLHSILGAPERSKKSRFGPKIIDYWLEEDLTITSSDTDGVVMEISFGNVQIEAEIQGIKLFEQNGPDVYRELCLIDGAPREDVGFTVLFKLGVALDGFLVTDQEQRVVTAFAKGCMG